MRQILFLLSFLLTSIGLEAQSSSIWLYSQILKDSIEIIPYQHQSVAANANTIYVLDGKKMVSHGFIDTIQQLENQNLIPKYRYIFVSTLVGKVNPQDKREAFFFCNSNYVDFFEQELIPLVEGRKKVDNRYLLSVSFGGLCGSYFATKTDKFSDYALLSPITYPCNDILTKIAFSPFKGFKMFLSSGTNDAEFYAMPLIQSLKAQGHQVQYHQTDGGHDFENWMNQLEVVLKFFEE